MELDEALQEIVILKEDIVNKDNKIGALEVDLQELQTINQEKDEKIKSLQKSNYELLLQKDQSLNILMAKEKESQTEKKEIDEAVSWDDFRIKF